MKVFLKLFIFIGLLALGGWFLSQNKAKETNTQIQETTKVRRMNLSRDINATGVIRPMVGAEINVGAQVSGIVKQLFVKVGDHVSVGTLLAELDPLPFHARLAEREAELDMAEARFNLLESQMKRRQNLFDDGLLSREEMEITARDYAVAVAQVSNAKARLETAQIDLTNTQIKAPIHGVAAAVNTREGETVAAGFTAPNLVSIIDLERLEVQAFVDETDIGQIFIGQQANFSVDTWPDRIFQAEVKAINPKAEIRGSVVNYVVVLRLNSGDHQWLRPEMTAHVQLNIEKREQVLTLPRNCLRIRDGQAWVMVQRNNDWTMQTVRLGWKTDGKAEILEGLKHGETVLLN